MNNENKRIITEASNRFYADYKDSYGFLMLLYLCKNNSLSIVDNAKENISNEIERMDISYLSTILNSPVALWKEKGIKSQSIIFSVPDERVELAIKILCDDLKDCKKCNSIEPVVLFEVVSLLLKVDYTEIGEEFWDLIDFQSTRIQRGQRGDRSLLAPNIQPKELCSFIGEIAGYDGGVIFCPTAQTGRSIAKCKALDGLVWGYESNAKKWAVGVLRLISQGRSIEKFVNTPSSDYKWPGIKPSLILAMPFGIHNEMYEEEGQVVFLGHISAEKSIFRSAMNFLSEDGKLVMEADEAFLRGFSEASKESEEFYIKAGDVKRVEDYYMYDMSDYRGWLTTLSSVIRLPRKLYGKSNESKVICVFDKKHKENDPITMVDGSSFFLETPSVNIFKWKELLRAMQEGDLAVIHTVSLSDIKKFRYNIDPAYFVSEGSRLEMPKGRYKALRELVKPYEGRKPEDNDKSTLKVGAKTIDGIQYQFSIEERKPVAVLESACLLLHRFNSLRPFYFQPEAGKTIGRSAEAYSFFVNEGVDINYLLSELNKPYVKQQIAAKKVGSSIPCLSMEDVLNLMVVIPESLDEQKKAFDEGSGKRALESADKYVRELEAEYKQKFESFEREMHLRKHSLQNRLNAFIPGLSILLDIMNKNGGSLNADMVISNVSGDTVKERLEKLKNYAGGFTELVLHLTDKSSDYDKPDQMLAIDSFVQNYCDNKIHDRYTFETMFDRYEDEVVLPSMTIDGEDCGGKQASKGDLVDALCISMSPKLLTVVLDNIISNAERYGFTDLTRKDYKIRISESQFEKDGIDYVSLKIANNGTPLAKGMTPEKVFQWGESSEGTGLGGWHIATIVNHYGGYAKMNNYPDDRDGFTIEYELSFPISNFE